ncbi:hypothetical protein BKP45_11250 [Anaerobacillus alkalidiazotrophicus]|uniref:Uncharacterized protein n=1 Tax=Anaerobacillus alkalidiazotrophicus TaxID=472963 RepID=A0A1S2M567_9BACI|nr:hypothetical protein BKP45_16965 [Anaerobacillus alkalidiazotrophicus]OIJ19640.1 hypothetical protein BKP45_11250 [Anaerobacillus alkalidiazotrophicus]
MKLINEGFQEVTEVSCLTKVTELVGCLRKTVSKLEIYKAELQSVGVFLRPPLIVSLTYCPLRVG